MAFQPTRVQEQLGAELKKLRTDRSLTQEEVAPFVGMSQTNLGRKENAKIQITLDDVVALCRHYGVDGPGTARLSEMALASRDPQWWKELEDYLEPNYFRQIRLENDAVRVLSFRPSVVHGLLQTEDYMRAIFARSGNAVDPFRKKANMRARLGRQRRLDEPEKPLMLDAIMDDSILQKDFGDVHALLGQLRHLLEMSARPNVTIRLLPIDAPVVSEQLEVFIFGDRIGPAVAIVESVFGVVIVENALQVEQNLAMIEHVSAHARTPEQTAELIKNKITELELAA